MRQFPHFFSSFQIKPCCLGEPSDSSESGASGSAGLSVPPLRPGTREDTVQLASVAKVLAQQESISDRASSSSPSFLICFKPSRVRGKSCAQLTRQSEPRGPRCPHQGRSRAEPPLKATRVALAPRQPTVRFTRSRAFTSTSRPAGPPRQRLLQQQGNLSDCLE